MKITRVDIASVRIPPAKTLVVATYGSMQPEFVLTKVYTDDGIVGFGESPPLPETFPLSLIIKTSSLPIFLEILLNELC